MFRKILLMLLFCSTSIPCWTTVVLSSSLQEGRIGFPPVEVAFPNRWWELHVGLEGSVTTKGKVGVEPTTLVVFDSPSYPFSIGDPSSDPRLIPLHDSGFSFDFPSDRHYGKVKAKPVSMYDSLGWWCSKRIMDSLWIHMYGIHGDEEGMGTLVEGMAGDALFRLALLGLDNRLIEPAGFVIDYGSLPMERGFLGYGYWSGRAKLGFFPLDIVLRWLGRCSYDGRMGVGFTERCLVGISHDMFRLSYTRVRIPLQVGPWAGGGEGPLLRDTLAIEVEGERVGMKCTFTDSWWRKPVYAGESQKRTLKIVGSVDYHHLDNGFGLELGYESQVRTSGTHLVTYSCELHGSTIWKNIACSFAGGLSYTTSFSYDLVVLLSWELDDGHAIRVKLKGTADSIRVSCSFNRRVAGTEYAVDLDVADGPSISCSIDRDV